MLDAFLGTKAPPSARSPPATAPAKKSKGSKQRSSKHTVKHTQASKSRPCSKAVEGYDARSVHAQYTPGAAGGRGVTSLPENEEEPDAVARVDEFAYLAEEEEVVAEEQAGDDSDSCVTFEEEGSVASESSEVSDASDLMDPGRVLRPAWARRGVEDPKKLLFSDARRSRASEPPVFSGPSLWVEDDSYID